jgi:branched-chain amino acid transport system substrate-binding protein
MGGTAEGFVTVSGYSPEIDTPANKQFVKEFRAAFNTDPDLYGADSYGLMWLYKAAVEKAGSAATKSVRKAMEGQTWKTPQGDKTMRAGDHQAQAEVFILKVKGGKFSIVDKIAGNVAIGPDTCEKF